MKQMLDAQRADMIIVFHLIIMLIIIVSPEEQLEDNQLKQFVEVATPDGLMYPQSVCQSPTLEQTM